MTTTSETATSPTAVQGTGVVPGVAYARAVWAKPQPEVPVRREEVPAEQRDAEVERLVAAADAVASRLEERAGRVLIMNRGIKVADGTLDELRRVARLPTRIRLRAQDPDGAPLEFEMEGFEARAAQHELDHLDGLLFVDRVVSRRTDLYRRKVYLSR